MIKRRVEGGFETDEEGKSRRQPTNPGLRGKFLLKHFVCVAVVIVEFVLDLLNVSSIVFRSFSLAILHISLCDCINVC